VSKGQQYLQFFGSDALKRLHGCAIAESDRGADSPCERLAQPLRRPQVGFGNPEAPIVFISPSPLDAASASNEAFTEWLDHEGRLEHHMTADTPLPYFQFVRAVMLAARKRMGQKLEKHDVMDSAFHTWAVRCATENPDRVTDAALNQCVDRHLQSLLERIAPQAIVAMGGPVARHLWWRTMKTWEYKIINVRSENYSMDPRRAEELNRLGDDGWELVSITSINFKTGATDHIGMVFKREKQQQPA